MLVKDVIQSLRAALISSSSPINLDVVSSLVKVFLSDLHSLSPEDRLAVTAELESELQITYETLVDPESTEQVQCFLAVLYSLREALAPSSIVSLWFYLAMRPALRNSRLDKTTHDYVKDLVVMTIQSADEESRSSEIQKRIMDLYLLDAPSEHSAVDALEDADLDPEERERRRVWKENLQDILITDGLKRPRVRSLYSLDTSPLLTQTAPPPIGIL